MTRRTNESSSTIDVNINDIPAMSPEEEFKQLVELCVGEELSLSALKEKVETCSSEAVQCHGTGETLLHHVCANKNVSLEMVYFLVSLYPKALKHATADRVLPLHQACKNKHCSNGIVEYLVSMHPKGLRVSSSLLGLPLHCLVSRQNLDAVPLGLVRMMVDKYPQALTSQENEFESTPLFLACSSENISVELIQVLADQDFESMSLADRFGEFPLHALLCTEGERPCPPLEVIQYFVEKAPGVLSMRDSSGKTPIHVACRDLHVTLEIVQLLVQYGGGELLEWTANNGTIPLHSLASNDLIDDEQEMMAIVEYLVQEFPASLRMRDGLGSLPLHYSCSRFPSTFNQVTQFLVQQYPLAVTVRDNQGLLPIHHASEMDNVALVRLLYELDPDSVSARTDSGELPLHVAAYWGNAASVRFLIEKFPRGLMTRDGRGNLPLHCISTYCTDLSLGRDVFFAYPKAILAENIGGSLPVHIAFSYRRAASKENLVLFLIEQMPYGMRMSDLEDRLPVHLACSNKYMSLELLMKAVGAYPDALRWNSPTHGMPIHVACKANLGLEVIMYLESMCAESLNFCHETVGLPMECTDQQEPLMYLLNKRYNQGSDQKRPLCVIFQSILNDDVIKNKTVVASRLIKFFPSLASECDHHGSFPLHHAVASDLHLSFINKLVELNPEAGEKKDSMDQLPLHYALRRPEARVDVVALMLGAFPQGVSATDHQARTPLHIACRHGASLQVVALLTAASPDGARSRDQHECTPLHVACRHGSSVDVVQHLLERDETTLHMLDENGETPLHKACRGGHGVLVQHLVERYPTLAFVRNRSGMLPVLLLSQSSGKSRHITDTQEYMGAIWNLLLAHPECVMGALN